VNVRTDLTDRTDLIDRTDLLQTHADAVSPAYLWSALDPRWVDSLSPAELAILPWCFDVWLRPEQHIPSHKWRTCGLAGGRGFGKSIAVARWINARVMAGLESKVAFLGPTEDRVDEVQRQSLIDYAEPWQCPERDGKLGLVWPNGIKAIGFTSEREGRSRSQNVSLAWLTEIVDWKPGTREEAFRNLYTATRVGESRVIWDSTAKGRNEVRTLLEELHEHDPEIHVIVPGTMFDNPGLSTTYLRSQWGLYSGVRREEELMGASYRESEGALWTQVVLDRARVGAAPELDQIIVTIDPATSVHDTADETGINVGGRGKHDGHTYLLEDLSGKHTSRDWADLAIKHADPRTLGPRRGRIGVERKRIGDAAAEVLKSRAETAGLRVRVIGKDEEWPPFDQTCLFIREYSPQESKGSRADGPAAETEAQRVHLVDPEYPETPRFADLEKECTTYVPGVTKRSPNRLDAFAYLVAELRDLRLDSPPDHARDAATAARLHDELQTALRRAVTPEDLRRGELAKASFGGVVRGGRRLGL